MRLERVGLKFADENKRLEQQVIAAAAASMHSGTVTAGPHVPTPLDDASRVVELERARLEGRPLGRRNDPVDRRPFLRTILNGPVPQIPAAPSPVALTRAQLEAAILDINAQLSSRYLMDKDLIAKRDGLVQQLNALPR